MKFILTSILGQQYALLKGHSAAFLDSFTSFTHINVFYPITNACILNDKQKMLMVARQNVNASQHASQTQQ